MKPYCIDERLDDRPTCPACGSKRGDHMRLLCYEDGTVICNVCHGHMFYSPTEKPMSDPNAITKEQKRGLPPSDKQVRDATQARNLK